MGDQGQLAECPASRPVARAEGDDALGLTAGFVQVSELAHAPRGLTGERAFIEMADLKESQEDDPRGSARWGGRIIRRCCHGSGYRVTLHP